MAFTVTKFTKGNTFAVTARDSAEQAALQAAYAAAGFAGTVIGDFEDAGSAKTAKGNAVADLLKAGSTPVPVKDRPAVQPAKTAKVAKAAKPMALKAAPKAAAPKKQINPPAPNQAEINRANHLSAIRQHAAELAAKPQAMKAPKAADPAKVAARQAKKATKLAARKPKK